MGQTAPENISCSHAWGNEPRKNIPSSHYATQPLRDKNIICNPPASLCSLRANSSHYSLYGCLHRSPETLGDIATFVSLLSVSAPITFSPRGLRERRLSNCFVTRHQLTDGRRRRWDDSMGLIKKSPSLGVSFVLVSSHFIRLATHQRAWYLLWIE